MTAAFEYLAGRRNFFVGTLLLFSLSLALSKSAMNILIGVVYLSVFYFMLRDRSFRGSVIRNVKQPLLLPFILYIMVALIGLFFTERPADGIGILNKMAGMVLVYLMVSTLLDAMDRGRGAFSSAERLLAAYIIGIFFLDIIALLTYAGFIGHKKLMLPLAPLHVHHIWFSNLNAIGLYAAAAFLLFPHRQRTKKIDGAVALFMLISLACIALSLSRTAWFGLLLTSLIMTALLSFMTRNRKPFLLALLAIMGASLLLYGFSPFVQYRISMIYSDIANYVSGYEVATSLGARFLMWKAAFLMFLSNPLVGVGTGDYVLTMNRYMASGEFPGFLAEYNQPHNMYLFALATNGLLGLAALLFIFYRSFTFSIPVLGNPETGQRALGFLAVATTVHFMIAGLTDSFFNIQILRYTFAFVTGVSIRNSLRSSPEA
ncbi:MAG: hypothetical protein A2078_08280 [Nitrospirae bacterium GWC2_57_9]|nr:MAG: hypothetical protein A2078_08280 [Nitrospirae bacterium GWC2_57_9]